MPDSGYPWPIETTRLDTGLRVVVIEDLTAPAVGGQPLVRRGLPHGPAGQPASPTSSST